MAALWITEDDLSDPTSPDAREAARAASMVLFALSGRKYGGINEITEIYEPAGCNHRQNAACGCFGRRDRLRLRYFPVRSVESVVRDWESANSYTVPDTEYDIVDRTYLRPTRSATWSPRNNLMITYTYGTAVPEMGLRAARILGNELLKARCCPDECALPDRVTSVSRQGVTFAILDPQDFLKDGRTGLYEVDLFLKATNPDNARMRSRVFTPDTPRASRITTPLP